VIGVKRCGEFHTKALRVEHGGGRWKKYDGTSPTNRESVLAERRHARRKARLDLKQEAA
jgi:hypothetical protein